MVSVVSAEVAFGVFIFSVLMDNSAVNRIASMPLTKITRIGSKRVFGIRASGKERRVVII